MTTTLPPETHDVPDVADVADVDATPAADDSDLDLDLGRDDAPIRHSVAVLCTAVGAAIVVGGVFTGVAARVDAVLAVLLGGVLAYFLARLRATALVVALGGIGILLIGVVLVFLNGSFAVGDLPSQLRTALAEARTVRPPIDITPGFVALLGWILAIVGFVAVWCAVVVRKAALGMLLGLPVAGIAAISVAKDQQIVSGLIFLALFGVALGVLSGDRTAAAGTQARSLRFELRRMASAVPFLAVAMGVTFALSQADFLLPPPVIDPAHAAQKPTTVPITQVPDRDLFDVTSKLSGPWVLGTLDVYDGTDWRLPPIADSRLVPVPANGIVDPSLRPGLQATITVRALGGAVLPGLANTVGIQASGPSLAYDTRSQSIRLVEGQVGAGFSYKVAAAGVPSPAELQHDTTPLSADVQKFTAIPPAPRAIADLLAKAPHDSKWQEFDWVRHWILDNVTATGAGTPVSITPQRVEQILAASTREASPFEIVAMQAMAARWVGLPARIGYGFDGGEQVGDHLEVHPKHGAVFPEVYFPGYEWLPVIGTPSKAKVNLGDNPKLQQQVTGQASEDIAVQVFLPVELPAPGITYEDVRNVVLVVVGLLLLAAIAYFSYPLGRKAYVRWRRRTAALAAGPRARVIEAYAQWRDMLSDFGYAHHTDTPLMLLQHFAPDEQHAALAWLVTRTLWGDLQESIEAQVVADAEELARTLRRRLAQAHPITVRTVAAMSRLSLRHPYAPPAVPPSSATLEVHRAAA